MAIGKNIKFHRKTRLRWTLKRLETASGVDAGTINALENRDSSRSDHFVKIAHGLGLTLDELQIDPLMWVSLNGQIETNNGNKLSVKVAKDRIEIPLLNATASMGNGNSQSDTEIVVDLLAISKTWASKSLKPFSDLNNLAFIHAVGDSMNPTFNDGDVLMIDTGEKSISADKIYVLQAHQRLFIKRVRQRLNGEFEISSDNPSVKTIDILDGQHDVEVLGRVVWVWNGKKP